ncbi:hypothetical protein ACFFLZ_10060 [Photobacterium aphoticum]|uniref:DNA-binding protein n=1 Tax=Photobacterium aphoticum TaxID=754436 RepID=A0A0J1GH51_9GAMM|nr:hypothetical protein [Photobacterium aphoticum]KLU98818.1 hypothetical protein ABT58_20585 [Photobacterium aphoticum]PSU56769.1 hypothetical protein C9I90_11895 [Photobacterium aphoticum]GHA65670.1 hypothetical protein GCM10007086_44080 [Photobacterium aphoticum]
MKYMKVSVACLSLILSAQAFSATKIAAMDAAFHEGEKVVACGVLKEISRFKRGVYLNLDAPYPQQSLTLVVWENDLVQLKAKHGDFKHHMDSVVCGKGTITEYKGRHQISLYNAYAFKVGEQ